MNALVFAAGLGTRLRPFTLHHPKALVEVGGMPMLQRVLLKLKNAGVGLVVVNVHHFAYQIIEFLNANQRFGLDLVVSDERDHLLDTGGGILKAAPLLGEDAPFIVHNADILTDFPIDEMISFHDCRGNDVSLLVAARKTSRYLYFDRDDRLAGWGNISTGEHLPDGFTPDSSMSQLAFGGVHVISPSVLPVLSGYAPDEAFPIVPFYVDKCRHLKIGGFQPAADYHWHDIGKPESLAEAEESLR